MTTVPKIDIPARPAWMQQGACVIPSDAVALFDPVLDDVHFPDGRGPSEPERRAKRVCASCPVMAECREYALRTEEPYGVWGGLSERERAALLHGQHAA